MTTDNLQLDQPIAYPCAQEDRHWQTVHPSVGLKPQKLSRILTNAENNQSGEYFSLCTDIEEKWPRYATVLSVRKRQVAGLSLHVQCADRPDKDGLTKQHSDLIARFLDTGILQDSLISILDAIGKGVSVTEMTWHKGDLWLPEKLYPRAQQWFEYVSPNTVSGNPLDHLASGSLHNNTASSYTPRIMMKKGRDDFLPLPAYRFIVHSVPLASGTVPYSGLGRIAAWWYLFYNHAIKDWLGFMEVYGKPLRLGKYPSTATDDEKQRLRSVLSTLGSDGSAVVPDNVTIDFLQNAQSKASSDIYLELIQYIDERITEVVLGQTLTTNVKQGSFAAAKVHNDVRQDIASADANLLIKTLERDIVKPIIDINFGPQKFYPKLTLNRDNPLSRKEKIDYLLRFMPLGLEASQEQIRNLIGLDAPTEHDLLHKKE